jgi:L-ascorbate metabolism protein UlaG (beta-lactamase superfamily)
MKITKFVHSCLLVETGGENILCDPGQFSWESGVVDVQKFPNLDTVVVTHEHFDHFHKPFVEAILARFPDVWFVTTPPVAKMLADMGVKSVSTDGHGSVKVFSKKRHASIEPLGEAPENIAVHIADTLTVGGDRHDLEESKQVLALSVTAPWGHMMEAAAMAMRLQPKVIVPVHDWHWNEAARAGAYGALEGFFKSKGITFIKPVDGQAFEVGV